MLSTYLDLPAIDWVPDWKDTSPRLQLTQDKVRLDSGAGPIDEDVRHQPRPRTRRTLNFILASRAECVAARAFLRDTSLGMQQPFWVALGLPNLELAAPIASAATTMLIDYVGYSRFNFGAGLGREHVSFMRPGAAPIRRKITAAVDNEDGTETLTLSSAPGADLPATTEIQFITLNRLDRDLAFVRWASFASGTLVLPLVDLPRETP